MNDKYSSIIDAPYKKSDRHPHMSLSNRSAQFAPFAALTGFDESIVESGKILVNKIKISDEKEEEINNMLIKISNNKKCRIKITYFENIKNNKGQYKDIVGFVKEIDILSKLIKLDDNSKISFKNIYSVSII